MGFTTALLTVLSFYLVAAVTLTPTAAQFACNSTGATCNGLVGYVSPNSTTLGHIKSLFDIKNLRNLLGANGLPPSTPSTHPVAANETLQIPFVCLCRNGTGLPRNHRPAYTVVPGDGLYHIAAEVFAGLAVNNISNANLIIVGEDLWIPLPCSCDEVGGERVVHYGYVVPSGATVEEIAQEYNTTQDTLLALNGLTSPKDLLAGAVLDVPLQVSANNAQKLSLQGWSWSYLLISIHLVVLCSRLIN
ncbi:hypothetical protein RHSIM_RhsimUnG0142700 [Rhododendron simsii]|uniref:LysM domain-containing protein n=1 Tax=Rhododendron simsii TaxID=118357 RepID=A0A834L4K8_RHOSS|nr:hypothetical protein RHSIM_RhsimUnG0142700 [Rhododendron simsii]